MFFSSSKPSKLEDCEPSSNRRTGRTMIGDYYLVTRWAIEWESYFRIVPLFQQESLWYRINLIANIVAFSKNQLRLCPEAVKSQIFTRSWVWGATEKDKTWLNRLISCRPEIRLWSVWSRPRLLKATPKKASGIHEFVPCCLFITLICFVHTYELDFSVS